MFNGVTGVGPTLRAARERAYTAVQRVAFQDMHYRQDIAALDEAETSGNMAA